ncbi:hypothetical protein ACOME3_005480 [Neoechinorhynchus agilis]
MPRSSSTRNRQHYQTASNDRTGDYQSRARTQSQLSQEIREDLEHYMANPYDVPAEPDNRTIRTVSEGEFNSIRKAAVAVGEVTEPLEQPTPPPPPPPVLPAKQEPTRLQSESASEIPISWMYGHRTPGGQYYYYRDAPRRRQRMRTISTMMEVPSDRFITSAQMIHSPMVHNGYEYQSYSQFKQDCLAERTTLGPFKSEKMHHIYRFWSFILRDRFNRKMYEDFKRLAIQRAGWVLNGRIFIELNWSALEDSMDGYRYGLECLFRFYSYGLERQFRDDVYRDFETLTLRDYDDDHLYGLEKFWAFLKYSGLEPEINPRLHAVLDKYKTLEDFRVDGASFPQHNPYASTCSPRRRAISASETPRRSQRPVHHNLNAPPPTNVGGVRSGFHSPQRQNRQHKQNRGSHRQRHVTFCALPDREGVRSRRMTFTNSSRSPVAPPKEGDLHCVTAETPSLPPVRVPAVADSNHD